MTMQHLTSQQQQQQQQNTWAYRSFEESIDLTLGGGENKAPPIFHNFIKYALRHIRVQNTIFQAFLSRTFDLCSIRQLGTRFRFHNAFIYSFRPTDIALYWSKSCRYNAAWFFFFLASPSCECISLKYFLSVINRRICICGLHPSHDWVFLF